MFDLIIEQYLHISMRPQRFLNPTLKIYQNKYLKSHLRFHLYWFEILDIFGVEEHESHC